MIKIGNIISSTELVNHTPVDYINYYNQKISYKDLNSDLPTLYVGWGDFKESNKDTPLVNDASILEKRLISKQLYWEFSFDENKSQHVGGVQLFTNDVPFYYFSSRYEYVNYDPIFFGIQSIEELFALLPPAKNDCVYNYKNEMLYILLDKHIFGIDLKMYEFFQFNVDMIVSNFSEKTSKYVFDEDGSIHQTHYKSLPYFDQLKRYLVVLVSKG